MDFFHIIHFLQLLLLFFLYDLLLLFLFLLYFLKNFEIDAFVQSKAEWIEATAIRLAREKERQEASLLKLENGDTLP